MLDDSSELNIGIQNASVYMQKDVKKNGRVLLARLKLGHANIKVTRPLLVEYIESEIGRYQTWPVRIQSTACAINPNVGLSDHRLEPDNF